MCRPPGHHATTDQFGGYCYLNNAAIAAQRLLDGGASCVAILDVDYHHGNGTQAIFAERSDVLFISIHADPVFEFPWFTGHASEIGQGDGEYWNLNLPLPAGTTMQGWMAALDTALTRIADADVDALVVSLGVDTYEHDPLGTFIIGTTDFVEIGAAINATGLPTVVLQEGGYAVERHRRQRRSVPPTLQLTGPHLVDGESSVVSDRRASAHQATAVFVPAGTSVKPPSWICTGASTTSFAHSASCRMDER